MSILAGKGELGPDLRLGAEFSMAFRLRTAFRTSHGSRQHQRERAVGAKSPTLLVQKLRAVNVIEVEAAKSFACLIRFAAPLL